MRNTPRTSSRFVLLAGLCVATVASADDCSIDRKTENCPAPSYPLSFSGAKVGQCPPGGKSMGGGLYCLAPTDPPGPVSVICEYTNNGSLCEVVPQGSGLTYGWTGTGVILTNPYSPTSPFRNIGCTGHHGHSVTVTVTGPTGLTSSSSQNLSCPGG